MPIGITALGTYAPERVLTNKDLEGMFETSDEWIVSRTGIRERRIAGEGEFASDMGVRAVNDLAADFETMLQLVYLNVTAPTPSDWSSASHRARLTGSGVVSPSVPALTCPSGPTTPNVPTAAAPPGRRANNDRSRRAVGVFPLVPVIPTNVSPLPGRPWR